ncbi:hypothetical protein [Euzebya pacifica]|uniref:alpha/beta hydrolase n=1 Tax=Euzebya pacifica TaxID=1608957 RepID=UPI0030FCF269
MHPRNPTADVFVVTADDVSLQARHRRPTGPSKGAVLLCHPHPAFGGHMDVWLLPAIASALSAAGWASLRLNFRGVEGSAGTQTGGLLEHLDAEAGLAHLRAAHPGVPLAAVGWSFGAMIALRLGTSIDTWVGVAPPTRALDDAPLLGPLVPETLPPRRHVVVGAHDQFFPPDTVHILHPDEVTVLPDTDHFFFDRDQDVAAAVLHALSPRTSR